MATTLGDIARTTRTSISTVSRVLAGGDGATRISPSTRKKVLRAAGRMGYRPNLVARSLRTRRSKTIALLVPDMANPWFGRVASLVEQSLHFHGYTLMLCNSAEDPEREKEYLRLLPSKGIDGLILVPLLRTKRILTDHLPKDLPIVLLDRGVPGVTAIVASDLEQAGQSLCDTLQRAGVKSVAIVSGPLHVSTHRRRADAVARRFEVIARHEGPAQKDTGRHAFVKFLHQQPDAIVCTNNFLGEGVIDSIAKIETPAIIGCFDEIPMMHLLPIPIVATVQDIPLLADGCVRQLLPQLDGEHRRPKPLVFPTRTVTNLQFQIRQFDREHP